MCEGQAGQTWARQDAGMASEYIVLASQEPAFLGVNSMLTNPVPSSHVMDGVITPNMAKATFAVGSGGIAHEITLPCVGERGARDEKAPSHPLHCPLDPCSERGGTGSRRKDQAKQSLVHARFGRTLASLRVTKAV